MEKSLFVILGPPVLFFEFPRPLRYPNSPKALLASVIAAACSAARAAQELHNKFVRPSL